MDSFQVDLLTVDSSHTATHYELEIKTMSGEKLHTILTRFTPDSIYMLPFYRKRVFAAGMFKIPREKEEFGITAENIKRLNVMLDAYIVSEEWLKEHKSELIEKGVMIKILSSIIQLSGDPQVTIMPAAFIVMLGTRVTTGTLVLPESGENYLINGNKEKYRKMLLELAGIKKRENINKFFEVKY